MNRCPALLPLLLLTFLVPCCSAPEIDEAAERSRPGIFVSIPPQKFLAERIAGDLVSVDVLLPPGQSPATYEPTPRQMNRLSDAALLFRVGVPFEDRLMRKITDTMPELEVVDTREGIELRRMESGHDHGHAYHGDHTHQRCEYHPAPEIEEIDPARKAGGSCEPRLDSSGHGGSRPRAQDVMRERVTASPAVSPPGRLPGRRWCRRNRTNWSARR